MKTHRRHCYGTLRFRPGEYFAVAPLPSAPLADDRPPGPVNRLAFLRLWNVGSAILPGSCAALLFFVLAIGMQGCSSVSSTARRAGGVALGSVTGALAAHTLSDGDPLVTGGGAVAGGLLTQLSLGRDPVVLQDGFDQGYVRGQSDAIKRHYFLRHALEQRPLSSDQDGRTVTYLLPGPSATPEGIRLAPHLVATSVKE